MSIQRVRPGQPLVIPASAYNSFIDTIERSRPVSTPQSPELNLRRPFNDFDPWFPIIQTDNTVRIWPGRVNSQMARIGGTLLTANPFPTLELPNTPAGQVGWIYGEQLILSNGSPGGAVELYAESVALGSAPTPTAGYYLIPIHMYTKDVVTQRPLVYRHRSTDLTVYPASGELRVVRS